MPWIKAYEEDAANELLNEEKINKKYPETDRCCGNSPKSKRNNSYNLAKSASSKILVSESRKNSVSNYK